ncbi:MAG: hypothetical protein AAF579_00235 [Cyanobacteria bacterium P01_C01_bin.118]
MENKLEKFLTAILVTLGLVIFQQTIHLDATASVPLENNASAMSTHASLSPND